MRVLALAPFPAEAAGTRFRLLQLREELARRGIDVTFRPFLDSSAFSTFYVRSAWPRNALALMKASIRRLADVWDARSADVLFVMREAAVLGPPLYEWLARGAGRCPMVLDLDDATYVRYNSPTYGRLAPVLKWPGKTDQLIDHARLVTCGNRSIAAYVASRGSEGRVIPTVVDTELFRPRERHGEPPDGVPTIGWVGSHSTFQFVEWLAPVLQDLAREHKFRLKLVGAGKDFSLPGVDLENLPWALDREPSDFASLDIGLYPIVADDWSVGKSGLKSIQYMAVGVPFVASPVGAVAELGLPGTTHLEASDHAEWRQALATLLLDESVRLEMGAAGRRHVLERYTVPHSAQALAEALGDAAS